MTTEFIKRLLKIQAIELATKDLLLKGIIHLHKAKSKEFHGLLRISLAFTSDDVNMEENYA